MPSFTQTNLASLRLSLAARVNDVGNVFYTIPELDHAIRDALRMWNALTGDARTTYALKLDPAKVWYDLQAIPDSPRLTTRTATDLLTQLQLMLMEGAAPGIPLTTQFTASDLWTAIQTKRDEFLLRTLCTYSVTPVNVTPGSEMLTLPQTVIDAPRAYWIPTAPDGIPTPLDKSDEYVTTAFQTLGPLTPLDPITYSAGVESPLTVRLTPPPMNEGAVEFLTINSQPSLPQPAATILAVPDDFTPAILWGALAFLLSISMQAEDKVRAEYAAKRFEQFIEIVAAFPFILSTRINGIPTFTDAVETLDSYATSWRVTSATPSVVGTAGQNLLALPSSTAQTVTLQIVGNSILPSTPNDVIALGQETLDALLDYAQHQLSFKMGGAEFTNTTTLMKPIMMAAAKRNANVSSLAIYAEVMEGRVARTAKMEGTADGKEEE